MRSLPKVYRSALHGDFGGVQVTPSAPICNQLQPSAAIRNAGIHLRFPLALLETQDLSYSRLHKSPFSPQFPAPLASGIAPARRLA